jgi:hypothetical protein
VQAAFGAKMGINTATRFSTETEALSIARYGLDSACTKAGEDAIMRAAAHFSDRYRTLFANVDMWSYRTFLKSLVMKYGPGPLLEGARLTEEGWHSLGAKAHMRSVVTHGLRRRAQARATGMLDALERGVRQDLATGNTMRTVHGLFPKASWITRRSST